MKISPVTVPYLHTVDGELILQRDHPYFYQVQGTLYCTERKWCDFTVWTKEDLKVVHIVRDEEFIDSMTKDLEAFFDQYFKQSVLNEFLYRNTHLYNFSDVY